MQICVARWLKRKRSLRRCSHFPSHKSILRFMTWLMRFVSLSSSSSSSAQVLPLVSACNGGFYERMIHDLCLAKFKLDMGGLDRGLWCSWPNTMEWVHWAQSLEKANEKRRLCDNLSSIPQTFHKYKRAVHNGAATTATLGAKTTNVLHRFTAITKYLFGDRGWPYLVEQRRILSSDSWCFLFTSDVGIRSDKWSHVWVDDTADEGWKSKTDVRKIGRRLWLPSRN